MPAWNRYTLTRIRLTLNATAIMETVSAMENIIPMAEVDTTPRSQRTPFSNAMDSIIIIWIFHRLKRGTSAQRSGSGVGGRFIE